MNEGFVKMVTKLLANDRSAASAKLGHDASDTGNGAALGLHACTADCESVRSLALPNRSRSESRSARSFKESGGQSMSEGLLPSLKRAGEWGGSQGGGSKALLPVVARLPREQEHQLAIDCVRVYLDFPPKLNVKPPIVYFALCRPKERTSPATTSLSCKSKTLTVD